MQIRVSVEIIKKQKPKLFRLLNTILFFVIRKFINISVDGVLRKCRKEYCFKNESKE